MRVKEIREEFSGDTGLYTRTRFLVEDEDRLLVGETTRKANEVWSMDLSKVELMKINLDAIYPPYTEELTKATGIYSPFVYVKKPDLLDVTNQYKEIEYAEVILREARVGELLGKNPHPNIAEYLGVIVDASGRITGIAYKRYQMTLHQCMEQIEAGVDHMHRLGHVHCGLKPHNIFFAGDGQFVIGDFNSCHKVGEHSDLKWGTKMWTSPDYEYAYREVDFYSLGKIRAWLNHRTLPKEDGQWSTTLIIKSNSKLLAPMADDSVEQQKESGAGLSGAQQETKAPVPDCCKDEWARPALGETY